VPLALCALYLGLALAFRGGAEGGGYDSLDGVAALFARRDGMPFLAVLPCLVLTFLLGPAGLLLFLALRLALRPGAGSPFHPIGESR